MDLDLEFLGIVGLENVLSVSTCSAEKEFCLISLLTSTCLHLCDFPNDLFEVLLI